MEMSQEKLEKMITKMFSVIKPNGVSHIEFEIDPIDSNEYYMNVTYIVPDDSEFLKLNPFSVNKDSRYYWNHEIKKTIENFFDTEVIINSSGISSESFYKQHNQ